MDDYVEWLITVLYILTSQHNQLINTINQHHENLETRSNTRRSK